MHQVDCEDFLRQDSPDAWVLAILCDFKDKLPREIIHAILTRLAIFEELKMLAIDVEKLATYRLGMEKDEQIGEQIGARKQALKIAKKMLEAELNPGQVASLTGLIPEEVERLKNESPKLNG